MKISNLLLLVFVFSLTDKLYAWGNEKTHPAITNVAVTSGSSQVDSYLKNELGLSAGLNTQLQYNFPDGIKKRIEHGKYEPDKTTRSILEWLQVGSVIEDTEENTEYLRVKAPWRARHHFHDPNRNAGLDNITDHPDWNLQPASGWLPGGASALTWAIDGESLWDPDHNDERWSLARVYFYYALTAQSQSNREAYLAESMMKLGCVLHLLEDMGVPAHTRNDFLFAHYRTFLDHGDALENDVEAKVAANDGNSLWSGNGVVVFDKLAKYFDTDTRDSEDYLGNSVLPPNTWGLSECSNYQFLSLSTVFGCFGTKYQFPHPDLNNMGTPITESSSTGSKIYFNGANYGVSHMARESYTYHKVNYDYVGLGLPPQTIEKVDSTITTDDEKVIDDYSNITIPRTIDYATGLANYFFRGQIQLRSIVQQSSNDLSSVKLFIKNKSMVEANPLDYKFGFKGGQFEVYWDDASGNRTKVQTITLSKTWNTASTLAYDEEMWISFSDTVANDLDNAVRFIVVYQGNILKQPEYAVDGNDTTATAVAVIEADNIQNIPTTALLLARFNNVYEDYPSLAENYNNHGFQLHYYEVRTWWQSLPNEEYVGRVIDTAANDSGRIFMNVYNSWNGNRIFHSSNYDPLEYFPHVVENDCFVGTPCTGMDGTCTISLWNMPDWQSSTSYTEGKQVGWDSPEGDCFEVYTCTLNHTSSSTNQPGQGSNWEDYWLLGCPNVAVDLDIDGTSETNEESPGGTVQVSGTLKEIYTLILPEWPDVWTNELNRGLATLKVMTGASKIRVWDNPNKTGQPLITPDNPEKIWQLSSETMPVYLYVEGVAISDSNMDVRLKFTVNYAGISTYDKINFTVQN